METLSELKKPSKAAQKAALESYDALAAALNEVKSEYPEIEIQETKEKIRVPVGALKLLEKILKATAQGKPVSIVPVATEMTTQAAAEFLGCSRPHLVKLLETGEISFTKIGKHRRVKFEDVLNYKKQMKLKQKELLIEMMKADEDLGLYDS